jgi:DNA-binding NtrC family response regulator
VPNKINVLLVDDEKIYLENLAMMLRRKGMSVCTASDGEEAIKCLEQEEFDAVVLDVRMPKMDGVTALHAIKQLKPLTPVLLLTGGGVELSRMTQALKCGTSDILLKPCPIETIISAIENASERKAIACELKAHDEPGLS